MPTRVRIRPVLALAAVLGLLCLGMALAQEVEKSEPEAAGFVLDSGFDKAIPIPSEKVLATEEIKSALAKHKVRLIPAPPKQPPYRPKGDEFQQITPEKDFSYDPAASAAAGPPDWCVGAGEAYKYTSEKGSIMLNGHPLYLKGMNWYGFEGELYVPHGLFVWSIEHFMKFLATHRFNAVRLPFSLEWIARGLDAPLLNIYVVQEDMRELTQGQVLERIFDAAAAEGIMILLDLHVIQVKEGIKDLWYDKTASPERVIDLWTTMLERFAGRWNLLGIDLKNEPHGVATWGKGHPKTDWNTFATHAIQTLAARVPAFQGVFFVEGVEGHDWDTKYHYWWGGDFDGVRQYPIATGNEALDKRVVYSPHIYGPEVFADHNYFKDPRFPENMMGIWDEQYGWIEKTTGRAVVLGEWGGTIVGDSKAAANQQKLAQWLVKACIPDNFWWCINPTTQYNGSLLGETYQIVDENVLRMLHFVQPKPTRFHHNIADGGSVCVLDGAFANARCAIRLGLDMNSSQAALKAEKEYQP